MSSVQQSVVQDIDIDHYFQLWVNKSLERNPELAKKINFVCKFEITRNSTVFSTWILDLSDGKGSLYRTPKQEVKCSITMDESDLFKAIQDKSHLNTGSRVALEKLQQFWVEADKSNAESESTHRRDDENKVLFDSIVANGYKSDIIFDTLKNRMHEEVDIVSKLSGIMQFDITKDNHKSVWTIDFTQPLGHNVYPGLPKDKPICILTMDDENFAKMMVNKFNPQKAFMTGKMKIKGQVMAIYKLFTVWIDAAFRKKRAPELPYIEEILFNVDLVPGLKSETVVFRVIQRLVKHPQLCEDPGGIYYFDFTKEGKTISKWKLDFTANKNCGIFSRLPVNGKSSSERLITISDEDFVLMAYNKLNIKEAIISNRIEADIGLAENLTKIFQTPIIQSKL